MILYLRVAINKKKILGKFDRTLNIYSRFNKIVIKGIYNVMRIRDCFITNCDSSVEKMVKVI